MKKFLCVLLALVMMASTFCACSEKNDNSDKISIVTTVFPPYDFAKAVAGEKAEVTMLVRPGSESHSFEPTPADMKKTADCDLFIMLGGESEDWATRLANSEKSESRLTVELQKSVELICSDDHTADEHSHEYDEHIWTSPENAIKMCRAICDALCSIDAENKGYYESNFENYKAKLLKLSGGFKEVCETSPKNTLVFGDRFPFLYFTKEYNLEYKAAFPGCNEQTEPDINTITELINFIKSENIRVVLYTEFSSQKTADTLCSETGSQKALFHSCHNVTKSEWENDETYLSLMGKNLETLKNALK